MDQSDLGLLSLLLVVSTFPALKIECSKLPILCQTFIYDLTSKKTSLKMHDIILHVFCCYTIEERAKYETCTFKIAQIWGFVHVMHLSPFEHVFWVLQSTNNMPIDCQLRNTQIRVAA